MKYTFFIWMSDLHAMPITNITHGGCYAIKMGVSTGYILRITLDNTHTAYKHICLQGIGCVCVCQKLPTRNNATIVINACNHRQCWKSKCCNHRQGHIFLLPLLHRVGIKLRRWSTRTILKWKSKIQMNRRRIVRLYEWYKAKTFCCAFFAAAMLTMVAAATIVRFSPVVCYIKISLAWEGWPMVACPIRALVVLWRMLAMFTEYAVINVWWENVSAFIRLPTSLRCFCPRTFSLEKVD